MEASKDSETVTKRFKAAVKNFYLRSFKKRIIGTLCPPLVPYRGEGLRGGCWMPIKQVEKSSISPHIQEKASSELRVKEGLDQVMLGSAKIKT